MKPKARETSDELRPEYDFDFLSGERGRYYKRLLKEGSNNVVLEPDIAKAFPNSAAVNDALRAVIELVRSSTGLNRRSTGPRGKTPRAR
ncbi:MAG: hypothetical protein WKH97_08165 [Casimicrobiaceae bacterium]